MTVGNDPSFPSMTNYVSSIPKNANPHLSSKSNPSDAHDTATTNCVNNDVSAVNDWLQLSARSLDHSLAATVKENFYHSLQHCQGSKTGSSVCSHINSVFRGGINASRNPPSQVSFAQPTVVHFDCCGTLGDTTAPTADAMQAPGTPACTVDPPSFPAYHTPSVAFRSTDIDSLMFHIASNVNSMDPIRHSMPCSVPGSSPARLDPVPRD